MPCCKMISDQIRYMIEGEYVNEYMDTSFRS